MSDVYASAVEALMAGKLDLRTDRLRLAFTAGPSLASDATVSDLRAIYPAFDVAPLVAGKRLDGYTFFIDEPVEFVEFDNGGQEVDGLVLYRDGRDPSTADLIAHWEFGTFRPNGGNVVVEFHEEGLFDL